MIRLEDFDIDSILIDKKSHENILIYDILDKIVINPKPLCIICDQIDGFIRIYDETIYNRISYLISLKSGITYIFSHYFAKIEVDSYDSLPVEKRLTLRNVIIHIKSVLNKDKNH